MGLFDFMRRKAPTYDGELVGIDKDDDVEKADTFNSVADVAGASSVAPASPDFIEDEVAAACISLISDTLVTSHLFVERFTSSGWEKVGEDELQRAIDRPQPNQSQAEFLAMVAQSMQVYGCAHIIKTELVGKLYYEVVKHHNASITTDEFNEIVTFWHRNKEVKKDTIITIRKPSILRYPLSPYGIARSAIAGSKDAKESNKAAASEQGVFMGIISPQGPALSPKSFTSFKNDVATLRSKKKGLLITNHKVDFQQLSEGSNAKKQNEQVNSYTKQIALAFRVPPTLLGDLENATYSNVQTTEIFFWNHVIRPLMTLIEEAFTMHLDDSKLRYKFDVSKVDALIVNFTNRLKAAKEAPTGIPFDQLNKKLSLEFSEFSRSDTSLQPAGLVPAEELGGSDF